MKSYLTIIRNLFSLLFNLKGKYVTHSINLGHVTYHHFVSLSELDDYNWRNKITWIKSSWSSVYNNTLGFYNFYQKNANQNNKQYKSHKIIMHTLRSSRSAMSSSISSSLSRSESTWSNAIGFKYKIEIALEN